MSTDDRVQEPEPIDLEETARSLNGFEEIAIEEKFRRGIGDLTGTTLARALLYVVAKREGLVDVDAFRNTMLLPLSEVEARCSPLTEDGEGKASPPAGTPTTPTS